jgi:GntR family transcriptional regulator
MFITISENNPVPLYRQIVEQVTRQIILGELRAGDPLPSIRQLAKELTTSVITTKRAYQELERAGYIYTRPGKGSFVAPLSPEKIESFKREVVREHLQQAVKAANKVGLEKRVIRELLEEVMEGDTE